ncbi:MAG: T9SS type A sorting domain-containing protein [Bacteroidetes bacterium]|nr:T9SS type A sorting domain-containing protein [Bacteroidota bacterium]
MKKIYQWLLVLPIASFFALGQVTTIDNFENQKPDTTGAYATSKDSPNTLTLSAETGNKHEGTSSLKVWSVMPHVNTYGTYTQVGFKDLANPANWGTAESLSIWINVTKAPTRPQLLNFRLQVSDNVGGVSETWIYQNNTVLDGANGWVNLRIPLVQRFPADGSLPPDSTGFSISPSVWGFSTNNKIFDADKIATWYLTAVVAEDVSIGDSHPDSLEVLYDQFEMFGSKAVPVTIYNGVAFSGIVSGEAWSWGSSSVSIEKGAGSGGSLTNAVMWTQGTNPGWGGDSGYTGWGVNLKPTNMVGSWTKDTLKFKMKAAAEDVYAAGDSVRVQFESANGKKGLILDLITDGAWHDYRVPLADMQYTDGKTSIDSAHITVFGIMAQKSGRPGRIIYISDIWTGNPVFDVIPPVAPTGVLAIGGQYTNIVTWTDSPNEPNATYDVFFSEKAFATTEEAGVEDLPRYKTASGLGAISHALRAPLTDQNVTYYYGVAAADQDGNVSALGLSPSVTSKARGVGTIGVLPPTGIVIDGELGEWESSTIKPIIVSSVSATGQGHVAGAGVVNGDGDLKVISYLAVDANNLYVAFDVDDDVYGGDSALYKSASYAVDGCDLFLGLYDWRGKRHTGYKSGATPDFHFRLTKFGAVLDNNGKRLNGGAAEYKWTEKSLTPGYIIEAKFPLKMISDSLGGGAAVLAPLEGMRIPIDYSINDNDNKTFNPGEPWNARDGILCYSPFNDDNSWQDMWRWSYTWIGAKWVTGVQKLDGVVATSFELSQNYPNPFNPSTSIQFSVPVSGIVSLKVYDVLGREVMDVMNQYQEAGSYTVSLDASKLATGMYVYRLESGSYTATKKMMFLK